MVLNRGWIRAVYVPLLRSVCTFAAQCMYKKWKNTKNSSHYTSAQRRSDQYQKQAGLSRATLELSFKVSYNFPLWTFESYSAHFDVLAYWNLCTSNAESFDNDQQGPIQKFTWMSVLLKNPFTPPQNLYIKMPILKNLLSLYPPPLHFYYTILPNMYY